MRATARMPRLTLGLAALAAITSVGTLPALLPVARAENVDPADAGEQYAWGENVGWFNAQPFGPGGPGLQVGDYWVTGWFWGENIGWVNLSCFNRDTCDAAGYGVSNDGLGRLSGYAWAENAGWIDFDPAGGGVRIDPATGVFSGWGWGENIGWINFAPASPVPAAIRTSWRCDPVPAPPAGSPWLTLQTLGADTELSWTALPGASCYDVIRGDLRPLLESGGDFSSLVIGCHSRRRSERTYAGWGSREAPAPGEAFWFLIRGANCGAAGTYDSGGPGQAGSRDGEVLASGGDCG